MGRGDRTGFVLVGGSSSRMGRDKALLPAGGRTLVEQVAEAVRSACGDVTLIGAPERYSFLGLPVIADARPGSGPLGGLYTALKNTCADWNLVVACDMPGITPEFLEALLAAAENANRDCLVPLTARGLEPLCAVYHARVLPAAERALDRKQLTMQEFVRTLDFAAWPSEGGPLRNVNTPEEWNSLLK